MKHATMCMYMYATNIHMHESIRTCMTCCLESLEHVMTINHIKRDQPDDNLQGSRLTGNYDILQSQRQRGPYELLIGQNNSTGNLPNWSFPIASGSEIGPPQAAK